MSKINTATKEAENEDAREALSARRFGDEIRRLRLNRDLTQDQLGLLTGDKQGVISRVERAEYGVTLDLVYRLSIALHDDPYRLAAIFWDNYSKDYLDENQQLLNSIWEIMSSHYLRSKQSPDPQEVKPSELTLEQQIALGKDKFSEVTRGDVEAEATPDVEPPVNPQSDSDQEAENTNPTGSSK
jgi:transcriptional regulator with XRE-family HTH domain